MVKTTKVIFYPQEFIFTSCPIYKRIKIDDALEQLNNAEIVLFSTYVWNINLSLKIAEKLKTIEKDDDQTNSEKLRNTNTIQYKSVISTFSKWLY